MTHRESSGAPVDDEVDAEAPKSSAPTRPKRQPKTGWARLRKDVRRKYREWSRRANDYPVALFLVSLAILTSMLNVRYPSDEPPLWYFVPSLDVIVLLGAIAVLSLGRWKIPKAVRIALVVLLVSLRALRLGDGIQEHYFSEQFNLYSDLPLVPELFRFVYSALPFWAFVLAMLGALLGLAAISLGSYFALTHAERFLRRRRNVYIAGGTLAGLYAISSVVGHSHQYDEYFDGALAKSIVPRVTHEVDFLYNMYSDQGDHAQRIALAERRIRQLPTNLAKLGRKNVYLIFIESYGDAVFTSDRLSGPSKPVLDRFQSEVEARGFSVMSGSLDSTTYGGKSWLAHSTLATGIRVTNQLEYELVCSRRPKVLARFFRDAGYRTVLVQPGTTRAWPKGELYDFEKKYYLWNFDYKGPPFAWATMPDQYVLDFVRKREFGPDQRPLFIQYVLVSSHAPWSDLPPVIGWESVGDGSIYHRTQNLHFDVQWPYFANAQEAYIRSIIYDFEVLRQYITRWVTDDSLVILLGDHQPVSDLTNNSEIWGVPIHVLSRDKELLKPFEARGYIPGMRPPLEGARAGLETFLGDFLADFSTH
jgi:hypothetical protein